MKKLLSVLSVFALAAIAAGSASAGSITTPTGLNPGDQFRFVFVSTTKTDGTSSDLSTYDTIVSNDSNGYTYGGKTPVWQAIVSNATTDARDHIGLLSTSLIPLFTVDGTKVSTGNLWIGSVMNPINIKIDGNSTTSYVWTIPCPLTCFAPSRSVVTSLLTRQTEIILVSPELPVSQHSVPTVRTRPVSLRSAPLIFSGESFRL